MHYSIDGKGYIALKFQALEPTFPVDKPHVSLAHGVDCEDFPSWWRLKHHLCTLLAERQITIQFTWGNRQDQYILGDNAELTALCRMMQDIIATHHYPPTALTPATTTSPDFQLVQQLHMTFHIVGHNTV